MDWTQGITEPTDDLADVVRDLGLFALRFANVPRSTFHPDGTTNETDGEHTVMLGLIACALADRVGGLNVGLVAKFALVHDLPETYAGDVATLRLPSAEAKLAKREAEGKARARIAAKFAALPWVADTLDAYEAQGTPEARFVKFVDKMLPKILHWVNGGASPIAQGMTPEELDARYAAQYVELAAYAGEWPDLLDLYRVLVANELAAFRLTLATRGAAHA